MKNKKNIGTLQGLIGHIGLMGLIGLIGLIGLMGCSGEEQAASEVGQEPVSEVGQGPAVGFRASVAEGTVASGGTRADDPTPPAPGDGELTTELLQDLGFGVYSWYTVKTDVVFTNNPLLLPDRNPSAPVNHISTYLGETGFMLMRNQKVEYDDATGLWGYSPEKYWPLDPEEKLTFRAYAPYTTYLMTDEKGTPRLPVVITNHDYHDGTQHDPLWGTGKLVNTTTGEYYPNNPEPPAEPLYPDNKRYGSHYNNVTYEMSGNNRLKATTPADTRNGIIDWYFHHGMTKLMFKCAIIQDPGCDNVTIRSIIITPIYDKGLLSLNSLTGLYEDRHEKPTWTSCSEPDNTDDKTITLSEAKPDNTVAGDLAPIPTPEPAPVDFNPYPFVIKTKSDADTDYFTLLSKGLLLIPRDYSGTPMTVTVIYSIDSETDELPATGTIERILYGNTTYTINMRLTPSTQGLEITMVQSAFTDWSDGGTIDRIVYNW